MCRLFNESTFLKIMRKSSHLLSKLFLKLLQLLITLRKRYFNSNGVCFIEFYRSRSSNHLEPFHVQDYSRANTLVWNHIGSESSENECVFCKELFQEDETWLQCPSCKV